MTDGVVPRPNSDEKGDTERRCIYRTAAAALNDQQRRWIAMAVWLRAGQSSGGVDTDNGVISTETEGGDQEDDGAGIGCEQQRCTVTATALHCNRGKRERMRRGRSAAAAEEVTAAVLRGRRRTAPDELNSNKHGCS